MRTLESAPDAWQTLDEAAVAPLVAGATTVFREAAIEYYNSSQRSLFSELNPGAVADRPPTISLAISDAAVGEPFAAWLLICAPLLFVGVVFLILSAWIELQKGGGAGSPREQRIIAGLSLFVVLLQGFAAIGMVTLSQFRFPHFPAQHMQGSYLFFFSQAFVVLFGELLSRRFARLPVDRVLITAPSARFRKIYVWLPIVLGISYLALFILKDVDLGALNPKLYVGYTSTEPLLLSSFLVYVLTYHVDMLAALRRYFSA